MKLPEFHFHVHTHYPDLERLVSAISDFSDQMNAFFDRQDKAVTDLQGDVQSLTDQITALQGQVTSDADKASLAAMLTRAQGISDKLDALDALTPPAPPPAPPADNPPTT